MSQLVQIGITFSPEKSFSSEKNLSTRGNKRCDKIMEDLLAWVYIRKDIKGRRAENFIDAAYQARINLRAEARGLEMLQQTLITRKTFVRHQVL